MHNKTFKDMAIRSVSIVTMHAGDRESLEYHHVKVIMTSGNVELGSGCGLTRPQIRLSGLREGRALIGVTLPSAYGA